MVNRTLETTYFYKINLFYLTVLNIFKRKIFNFILVQ